MLSAEGRSITLRSAEETDCRLLWEWANDPYVRSVSFFSSSIPLESHVSWFQEKLKDESCRFLIAESPDRTPVGQVRYDIKGTEAVISVSLAKGARGKGYGSRIIGQASRTLINTSAVRMIHAYVKHGYDASVRAFLKAGFRRIEDAQVNGFPALHFVLGERQPEASTAGG